MPKPCPHIHYQILATTFNKRGLRRRQCRCTQCGHRWLTFSMAPAMEHAPLAQPLGYAPSPEPLCLSPFPWPLVHSPLGGS